MGNPISKNKRNGTGWRPYVKFPLRSRSPSSAEWVVDEMAGPGDPLLLFRQTLAAHQNPTLHTSNDPSSPALPPEDLTGAKYLQFPSTKTFLPLDTATRFQRKEPEPLVFNLKEIYFAWLLQAETTANYIAKCQALGIHNLTFVEKADLSTWLEGGDSSDYISTIPLNPLI